MSEDAFLNGISQPTKRPMAQAVLTGSPQFPEVNGTVQFFQMGQAVLVMAEVFGLPASNVRSCQHPIFAFHIHEGGNCSGNMADPFFNAMNHYNPGGCMHPYHAGDMPPLFGVQGYAFMEFLTDRFTVREILGKTVVVHEGVDDFTTQPSGNAGAKIACGVIERLRN